MNITDMRLEFDYDLWLKHKDRIVKMIPSFANRGICDGDIIRLNFSFPAVEAHFFDELQKEKIYALREIIEEDPEVVIDLNSNFEINTSGYY